MKKKVKSYKLKTYKKIKTIYKNGYKNYKI